MVKTVDIHPCAQEPCYEEFRRQAQILVDANRYTLADLQLQRKKFKSRISAGRSLLRRSTRSKNLKEENRFLKVVSFTSSFLNRGCF